MNNANLDGAFQVDKLDADAVCAQCSTVNAEGTLLCKVCGNNLRDQRNWRMQADQAMDMEHTGHRRRAVSSGILFVMAIGIIIATLVNQELIVEWLINVQTPSEPSLQSLWAGDFDTYFQPMLDEVDGAGMDAESAKAALENSPQYPELPGLYVLFDGETYLGTASVRIEGQEVYFVARLEKGEEVRGVARAGADNIIVNPESSALRLRRGPLISFTGVAIPKGGGMLECMGDNGAVRESLNAYRIPAP